MKNADKVIPEFDLEIGGKKFKIAANYRTIYNFEEVSGKPLISFMDDLKNITSVKFNADLIYSAIKHLSREYTLEWVLDNINVEVISHMVQNVTMKLISATYVTKSEADEAKKSTSQSETSENTTNPIGSRSGQ